MRWRIEVNFRHLKRTMGMDRLKCQSVDGVKRELLMYALIYNAVCRVRAAAARHEAIDPVRLSFVDTLRAIRIAWPTHAGTPPHPLPPKRWPLRPPRIQPRQLKRRHSEFKIMTWTRANLIQFIEAMQLYRRLYVELLHSPSARPPRLLVYLHAPLTTIVARIRTRGRPCFRAFFSRRFYRQRMIVKNIAHSIGVRQSIWYTICPSLSAGATGDF